MIGTRAVVSIGELRSITVFITGEAEAPGSYTVSSLSTITNALFASGGIKESGSLRNVQLKRRGQLVATLDLYDLLLRGDSSDDLRLISGDVIFIPPVGKTAGISGEVRRPAIYELKGESKASDLLYLAGGLLPDADPRTATVERIDDSRVRVVLDVDLTIPSGRALPLRSGDVMRIAAVRPQLANAVTLSGNIYRPGVVAWRQGLRVADVLPRPEDLKPNSDLRYVLIRRESLDHQVTTLSADLEQAWQQPASDANVALMPRDQVIVFNLEGGRELQMKPVLDDLRQQAVMGAPAKTVGVGGQVRAPGTVSARSRHDGLRPRQGRCRARRGGVHRRGRAHALRGRGRRAPPGRDAGSGPCGGARGRRGRPTWCCSRSTSSWSRSCRSGRSRRRSRSAVKSGSPASIPSAVARH